MKTLSLMRFLFFLTLLTAFASCSDKYYDDEYLKNSDAKLCATSWVDEYVTSDDKLCTQTLLFTKDKRGKDSRRYRSRLENGNWSDLYSESTNTFTWKWIDNTMEGLVIDYVDDLIYFDNVWVREHYLSGKWDGDHVTFTDIKYLN